MVLLQNWPFFHLFIYFQAIQARKMCFTILQNEKTPFQAIKTRSSNSRKTKIFNFFIFKQYRQQKCTLRYSKRKKSLSRLQRDVQNVEKRRFFQRGQSKVLVQNWPVFHSCILGNIGQENVSYNIVERKNAFLGYKNKKFKKSKN